MLRIISRALPKVAGCHILFPNVCEAARNGRSTLLKAASKRFVSPTAFSEIKDNIGSENSDAVNFNEICEGDEQAEKHLKILILELDIFRQEGYLVPDNITTREWRELITLPSRASRLRYLKFLFKNEKREENRKQRMEERAKLRAEQYKEEDASGHITYGFRGSTIFVRIYDQTMDKYMNKTLMNAAMYSQHIVFDCSYDDHMSNMEARNTAKQLCLLFSENRKHIDPFHIQFCNVNPSSVAMEALHRYIPQMYDVDFPMFTSTKSYLDLYPKEKLVYLTPHCKEILDEFNHDDIYIIGAIVDKSNPKPLSLAKAKESGIRMARLPLERHLVWGPGSSKNLTLDQMVNILLDLRHTGDWERALSHIPRRKILTEDDMRSDPSQIVRKYRPSVEALHGPKDVNLSESIVRKIGKKKRPYY